MSDAPLFLEVHIIQSVPPSCLNRDDVGSPKSGLYGGVRRARISSQSLKRAARMRFNERSVRTRVLADHLVEKVTERLGDPDEAQKQRIAELADLVGRMDLKPKKVDPEKADPKRKGRQKPESTDEKGDDEKGDDEKGTAVVPVSWAQIDRIVELLVEEIGQEPDNERFGANVEAVVKSNHPLDVALFGRMVAKVKDLNVDASCQVSHALSTHAVLAPEFDFYTASDDLAQDQQGGAMMGFIEFNSSTMYRYASVSLDGLKKNLGGSAMAVADGIVEFVDAFVKSLPSGRQNSFAATTLPDLVYVVLREGQLGNLALAFEEAVKVNGTASGYRQESVRRLLKHAKTVEDAYGMPPKESWACCTLSTVDLGVVGIGESMPFPKMLSEIRASVLGTSEETETSTGGEAAA